MSIAHRLRPLALLAAATSAAALALPSAALAGQRAAPSPLRALLAPTLPRGAAMLGPVAPGRSLQVAVALAPRDPAALASFAAAVSDRHSPMFRHYLARGEFAARFGPTAATVRTVEQYLAKEGLRVGALSGNHLELRVSGSVAAFEAAFHTQLRSVRLAGGSLGRTSDGPLAMPRAVARAVSAVVGLDELSRPSPLGIPSDQLRRPTIRGRGRSFSLRPRGVPGAPSACPAAQAATVGYGGITDDQVASAYGASGLYGAGDLAAGQTVAIFELEPFLMSDIKAFDECYFGADHTSQISVVPVDGGAGTGPGGGEAVLDVETVSALAPSAAIKVYEAPSTNYGYLDAYNAIVAADTAQVVSTSWGLCEQDVLSGDPGQLVTESALFEEAASQGQTVFAASGDAGNDDCENTPPQQPLVSVDDPASQPYVVGVGGTTAVSVAQPPAQQVWNDGDNGGAGGGGISTLFTGTPWQRAAAAAKSNRTSCGAPAGGFCRTVPDVSAFADEYTGLTIYYGGIYGGGWTTIGGTSMAAPIWAAMLAEVNASATCVASPSTLHGVGFAAPLLYDVAANPTDYASGFSDVTAGNNDILNDEGGKYAAGTGYDLASGLGSPELTPASGVTGPGLADSLCAAAQGGTTATITGIAPSTGAVGGGTPFTITGKGFYSGGLPDVAAVTFGTSPAHSFTVVSNTEITGVTGPDADAPNAKLAALTTKAGGALVTVTTNDGSVARGPSFRYEAESSGKVVPVVFQVGPSGGKGTGGNKVTVYGDGFASATKVTFGGVAAAFTVRSDSQLVATVPSDAAVHCSTVLKSSMGLCQAQVQVTGPGGKSPLATIVKPYTGQLNYNDIGLVTVPKGCGCEAYPSVSEYDYVTKLTLSKVEANSGQPYEDDPYGGDLITLAGTGLNVLSVNWVNVGPPSSEFSQAYGSILSFGSTGSSLQMFSPGDPDPTDTGNSAPVSISSLAGVSNSKSLAFGPVQQVDTVSTEVLPSAGGTTLVLHGGGFVKIEGISFVPAGFFSPPVDVFSNFTVVSRTEITLPSPSMPPGSYQVFVCGAYGCGGSGPNDAIATDTVNVNYPGETVTTSAEVESTTRIPSGSVAGGTTFEVQGANFGPLGSITVQFVNSYGEMVTTSAVAAGPAPTDPGATETILVTSPAALGGYPDVDLVVVAGADGTSPQSLAALFEYTSP